MTSLLGDCPMVQASLCPLVQVFIRKAILAAHVSHILSAVSSRVYRLTEYFRSTRFQPIPPDL